MEAILPPIPSSLARARQLVGLIRDAPRATIENAKLVLTELLANEIKHGRYAPGDPLVCRVDRGASALRIEVAHSGVNFEMPSVPVAPSLERRESGWGLALITRLADRWGVDDSRGARQVWAEIDVADGEGDEPKPQSRRSRSI
jgi:anti-sigma regulatory factor (Ser/Thr protein kinase)